MNHSRGRANVGRFYRRGQRRISFFTLRAVEPGEELLYEWVPPLFVWRPPWQGLLVGMVFELIDCWPGLRGRSTAGSPSFVPRTLPADRACPACCLLYYSTFCSPTHCSCTPLQLREGLLARQRTPGAAVTGAHMTVRGCGTRACGIPDAHPPARYRVGLCKSVSSSGWSRGVRTSTASTAPEAQPACWPLLWRLPQQSFIMR
jgi:hypothetical protein